MKTYVNVYSASW